MSAFGALPLCALFVIGYGLVLVSEYARDNGLTVALVGVKRMSGFLVGLGASSLLFALALGAACDGAGVCESGFCVDGLCCADACASPCQSCALAGSPCRTSTLALQGTSVRVLLGATPRAIGSE